MQGQLLAVKAALRPRERPLRKVQALLRLRDHGRIVHQPEPRCPGPGGEGRALPKCAVTVLFCLGFLLRLRLGGIAEEQVGVLSRCLQRRAGSRIPGEDEFQPPARRAQHLCRGHFPLPHLYRLSVL